MTRSLRSMLFAACASLSLVGTLSAQEPTPASIYDEPNRLRAVGNGEQREFLNLLERDPHASNDPRGGMTQPPNVPLPTSQPAYIAPVSPSPNFAAQTTAPNVPAHVAPNPQARPLPGNGVTQATYVAPPAAGAPAFEAPKEPAKSLPLTANAKPLALKGPSDVKPRVSAGWSGLGTIALSLSFVVVLLFVVMKVLKKTMPQTGGKLSRDVVQVLGRTPFAGRQSLQVIRFGNKILLVALSPTGCDTLTEIDDPLEVDRLAGLCQAAQPGSATQSFRDLLGQITGPRGAKEPEVAPPKKSDRIETVEDLRARLGTQPLGRSGETREVRRA